LPLRGQGMALEGQGMAIWAQGMPLWGKGWHSGGQGMALWGKGWHSGANGWLHLLVRLTPKAASIDETSAGEAGGNGKTVWWAMMWGL